MIREASDSVDSRCDWYAERIRERLEEIGDDVRVLVGREGVYVDVEHLRELDEERRRKRPAVRLDQVQVARRDADPLGELDLGELLAPAQRPHLRAEPRGFPRDLSHLLRAPGFYNV